MDLKVKLSKTVIYVFALSPLSYSEGTGATRLSAMGTSASKSSLLETWKSEIEQIKTLR